MSNHYRTLGVDPQAEAVVIRSAYLALIRRYHPDKGGEEADAARAQAVTAAWEVLRDPERRAAYDASRRAQFQPGGAGAAIVGAAPRVRGGAAARNLFLLLAAGTVALGWWALQQPQLQPPREVAVSAARPLAPDAAAPAIRPAGDEEASRRLATEEQPPLPDVQREPDLAGPVVLPPMPSAEPAPMPVRSAEAPAQNRRPLPSPRVQPPVPPAKPAAVERASVTAPAPAAERVDLAPLERHLQLLTDQSLRYGTEAKRARLFSTREAFLKRLRECGSDACKRDAYLRRNAEVAEIMRN